MRHYLDQLLQVKLESSTKGKVELLKEFDSPTLRDILYYAFSPTVVFGIGAVEFSQTDVASSSPGVGEFLTLVRNLMDKTLRGNAAKAAVLYHINAYPLSYREHIASIFSQTMSIGCEARRINEAFPNLIPVFGVQLANEYESGKMEYPLWISPKLDGMRCLAFHTPAGISLMSRTGKPIECMPHIEVALSRLPEGVYDGELMHPDGFQATVSFCRPKTPKDGHEAVTYNIFDYLTPQDWNDPAAPGADRFGFLRYLSTPPGIKVVPHTLVGNTNDLLNKHREFISAGYEGTMLQWNGPYVPKRGWHLQKLKPFLSLEGVVIGHEYGSGKFKKVMGNLLVRDLKTGIEFGVGSGFSNEERQRPPSYWVGRVIECQYQNLTDDGVPRFPTFMRERPDIELPA